MSRRFITAVIGLLGILAILLVVALVYLLQDATPTSEQELPTLVPTTVIEVAATEQPTNTPLPPPVVEVPPTFTPIPTSAQVDAPLRPTSGPTNTPVPTQPLPTNTATPVPTVFVPPTNTPVPPTSTPLPSPTSPNTRGLILNYFGLQSRSVYAVNQPVWFEFDISNVAGGTVPFGSLGVMPKKDGVQRSEWYQGSWGSNNDSIPTGGLQWEDNIKLPQSGNFSLRLVVCFESYQNFRANNNQGPWVTLSQEIAIFIN